MTYLIDTALPKLCHAHVGEYVRLPDPATGELLDEVFLICAKPEPKPSRRRKSERSTLSYEKEHTFLVSVSTGEIREMPHLSTRSQPLRGADKPEFCAEFVLADTDESKWRHLALFNPETQADSFETVSLRDTESVDALLQKIAKQELVIREYVVLQDLCRDEAKRFWRKAVAEGLTEMSFDEYLQAIHAN